MKLQIISMYEKKDTPTFLRQLPLFYQPLPFCGTNLAPAFLGKFRKLRPAPFYKGKGFQL